MIIERQGAPGSASDSEYGYSDVQICSANIQKLPNNHKALLATFPPSEQLKIIELLKLHSDYLSYDILLAMDKNDFDKILRALLSSLTTYSKYLFLPYYLPQNSKVVIKTTDDCKATLLTKSFIDIPASSHIYLDLDLQILCRSTFLQLSPVMTDGALFIQKLSSISVTAKHEFKSVFMNNSSHYNIRIPINYTLFVIEGLINYPTNAGNISQLKNLNSIVDLPSKFRIFTPQENQLYSDKEGTFLITCQNLLLSSYHAENISPDIMKSSNKLLKSFPNKV